MNGNSWYPQNNYTGLMGARSFTHSNSNRGNFTHKNRGQRAFQNHQSTYQSGFNSDYWCDVCDKGFPSQDALQRHNNEHQTCNIDGCKYVAHPNVITKHIQMQHSNGLYNKIRSTNTPEDIAKWISERKKKYPSTENVIKRQKINQEKLLRGEKLTSASLRRVGNSSQRFHRNSNNQIINKKHRKINRKTKQCLNHATKHLNIKIIDSIKKDDWKGELPPFPGTRLLFPQAESENESSDTSEDYISNLNDDQFEDEEWEEKYQPQTEVVHIKETSIKNALGLLMNNYESSDEDDIPTPVLNKNKMQNPEHKILEVLKMDIIDKDHLDTSEINTNHEQSDGELPDEVSIVKNKQELPGLKTRICTNNKKEHKIQIRQNKNAKNVPFKQNNYRKYRRQETLLEKLLRNEIRHERNILLQCIRYITSNSYFGLGVVNNAENQ